MLVTDRASVGGNALRAIPASNRFYGSETRRPRLPAPVKTQSSSPYTEKIDIGTLREGLRRGQFRREIPSSSPFQRFTSPEPQYQAPSSSPPSLRPDLLAQRDLSGTILRFNANGEIIGCYNKLDGRNLQTRNQFWDERSPVRPNRNTFDNNLNCGTYDDRFTPSYPEETCCDRFVKCLEGFLKPLSNCLSSPRHSSPRHSSYEDYSPRYSSPRYAVDLF